MEGDGDLMKMLMQADPPDENIQAPMEDSTIVQSGGYAQTRMPFGSGHYGGMQQQQLPTMGQQQQRGSTFHSMSPGQMIPRSPNNGMMQQEMDLVLQQQQYQQQQQQSAYGNGSFQGYNGGYQGHGPVSPQTHTQSMGPYQGGFPSEPGYPQGAGGTQAMGEFGPQAGPNQTMGIPGPASLSLANLSAMSNRQQYYADGYGLNQPVSPVHKQLQQSGGFLQPSRMSYSQQTQSYQSSAYPKRPSSSQMQSQMQGFTSGGSFTPRSSAGMQLPNMPYQSPTTPYQPPQSPVMRSSTSPVPQQDTSLYSIPRESFPQPRSPFGPSQGQFQQQQQQQQQLQSSCMFLQPSTTTPPSQYQSQQQMVGTKSTGLAQRRASYPGQQSTMKMPSPPLKRSPPSPLQHSKSPELVRGSQLGFDERGSIKAVAKKEKISSTPSIDPSQAVAVSKVKEAMPKIVSDGRKGLPRQRRRASDAGSPSVSPPAIKKEGTDGKVTKAEEISGKMEEAVKKLDNVEGKVEEPSKSNGTQQGEISSDSSKKQAMHNEEKSLQRSSKQERDGSCRDMTVEQKQAAVETTKLGNVTQAPEHPPSEAQQVTVATEEECKEDGGTSSDVEKSASQTKASDAEPQEAKGTLLESVEIPKNDGMFRNVKPNDSKELTKSEYLNGKGDELSMEQKSTNDKSKMTGPGRSKKPVGESSNASGGTDQACGESGKGEDEISKPVSGDKTGIPSEKIIPAAKLTHQLIDGANDEYIKTGKEAGGAKTNPATAGKTGQSGNTGAETNPVTAGKTGQSCNTGAETNPGTAAKTVERDPSEDQKRNNEDKIDEAPAKAKDAVGQSEERKAIPSSKEPGASTKSSIENKKVSANVANGKLLSKTSFSESTPTATVQKKPAVVSLRCDERLSSDDDDHAAVSGEAPSARPVESRTQGIQTTEQTTATSRVSHKQAVTPIKATIIAKGKSSQSNQQVMVAKTTTGQMYLIQGNILVPVQSVNAKGDSSSKQNSKVIIVNPVKSASCKTGGIKPSLDVKEKQSATSVSSEKEKPVVESSVGNKKIDGSVSKSDRSPNTKSDTKSSDGSLASKGSKMAPVQPEKSSVLGKEKHANKTASPPGKDLKNSPDKMEKTSSPSKEAISTEDIQTSKPKVPGRGRPQGSKDKQKRKSFVHKTKRENTEETSTKRKFSKTASVVKEMSSSSIETSNSTKRPLALDVPTVNASKSPKRLKISTSGSPVKHISTKPRGGVDGDSWVCSLCGKRSGCNLLGDLYGPYKTKFSKEKTDSSSSKDGKLSQKLSSPGRKSSSSSDTHADRKSSSSSEVREDVETCDVDLWIHRDCGVWSPGVFMLGRTIHGLEQAVESAAQHKCTKCSEVGATLACFKRGCNKMFHYACARDSDCSFIEDNFTIFCSTHK